MVSILHANSENTAANCYHLEKIQFLSKRFYNRAISTLTLKWSKGVPMDPKISFCACSAKTHNILTLPFLVFFMLTTPHLLAAIALRSHFVTLCQKWVTIFQKAQKFYSSENTIFFNFTSMWFKYLSNNVWRDFRLPMSASAMVI